MVINILKDTPRDKEALGFSKHLHNIITQEPIYGIFHLNYNTTLLYNIIKILPSLLNSL